MNDHELIRILAATATAANALAKQLTGLQQVEAYKIKASALSALILIGCVVVNGRSGGHLSLTVLTEHPTHIHVKYNHLSAMARQVLNAQAFAAPIVAPLREFLR